MIFQVSADERIGLNKVNLLSFELKNFFKFVLVWLAHEKQNILVTSHPCKRCFPKYGFFSPKMSVQAKKKIDTACL